MKTKYFTYANDGNTVVRHYAELEQLRPNLYITTEPADKDRYNEMHDIFPIIAEYKGVYWKENWTFRDSIPLLKQECGIKSLDELQKEVSQYYETVLECGKNGGFIKLLDLAVLKEAGCDIQPLLEMHDKCLKEREIKEEQKRIEAERKEKERQEQIAKETAERIAKTKESFLSNQGVNPEDFIEMARANGFEMHPRSIGALRKHIRNFHYNSENGIISYSGGKGAAKCENMFDSIRKCYDHLQKQTEYAKS